MRTDDDELPTEYRVPVVTVPLAAGTPTTGLWCETCQLPSRCESPVYALGADGPTQIGVQSICLDGRPH